MDNPIGKGDGGPKDKRRQQLIVGGTIVLVVLTFLIWRRSASSTPVASTPAVTDPYSNLTPATPADSGGGGSGTAEVDLSPITDQLDSIEEFLSTLPQGGGTDGTADGSGDTSPADPVPDAPAPKSTITQQFTKDNPPPGMAWVPAGVHIPSLPNFKGGFVNLHNVPASVSVPGFTNVPGHGWFKNSNPLAVQYAHKQAAAVPVHPPTH